MTGDVHVETIVMSREQRKEIAASLVTLLHGSDTQSFGRPRGAKAKDNLSSKTHLTCSEECGIRL